jgi:hypothetical protein
MKKTILLCALITLMLASCSNNKEIKTETAAVDTTLQFFGDTITADGAIAADQLAAQMKGKDSMKVKLKGTIMEVCQKKGCWMDMNIGNNQTMKVRFKDYAFFVPKNAANKTVIIEGVAYSDTTSVADLKHYAEDGGKTKEEIAKITEPEVNIGFEAHGVIIKK